jgi:hypothetical protein
MFVSFAYTECVSPGPFKKESGFKFKSVVQNTLSQGKAPVGDSELQLLLDKASGVFLPYRAPEIDPFMTREQFHALDKQWSLQRLDESHTMFTRMFTSGVSNGRPGNPFHQGFVFSKSDTMAIIQSTADMTDMEFARPVDFSDWAEWLSPKGDAELEAATLEQDNPPLPGKDDKSWKISIENLFKTEPQTVLALLSEFESSLRESRACRVFSKGNENFLTKVSLLTHLVPLIPAWRMEYSTGQLTSAKAPSLQMMDSDGKDAPAPGPWAQLAFELLINNQIQNIDRSIGQLTSVLEFSEEKPASWLAALPLAVALTPAQSLDSDLGASLAKASDELLKALPVPMSWSNSVASEMLLDLLSSPNQLLRQFSRSEAVYRKLSELPVVV